MSIYIRNTKSQNRARLSRSGEREEEHTEFDTSEIVSGREQIYENPRKGVQRSRNGASFEEDPRQRGGNSLPSGAERKGPIYIKQVKQKPRTNNERWCVYLKDGGAEGNEGCLGEETYGGGGGESGRGRWERVARKRRVRYMGRLLVSLMGIS